MPAAFSLVTLVTTHEGQAPAAHDSRGLSTPFPSIFPGVVSQPFVNLRVEDSRTENPLPELSL